MMKRVSLCDYSSCPHTIPGEAPPPRQCFTCVETRTFFAIGHGTTLFINSADITHGTQDMDDNGPCSAASTSAASGATGTSRAAGSSSACHYGSALISNRQNVARVATTMANIFLPYAEAVRSGLMSASPQERAALRQVSKQPFWRGGVS
jgi:hypothetical protein